MGITGRAAVAAVKAVDGDVRCMISRRRLVTSRHDAMVWGAIHSDPYRPVSIHFQQGFQQGDFR